MRTTRAVLGPAVALIESGRADTRARLSERQGAETVEGPGVRNRLLIGCSG